VRKRERRGGLIKDSREQERKVEKTKKLKGENQSEENGSRRGREWGRF